MKLDDKIHQLIQILRKSNLELNSNLLNSSMKFDQSIDQINQLKENAIRSIKAQHQTNNQVRIFTS